jgi:hypothetical protein
VPGSAIVLLDPEEQLDRVDREVDQEGTGTTHISQFTFLTLPVKILMTIHETKPAPMPLVME